MPEPDGDPCDQENPEERNRAVYALIFAGLVVFALLLGPNRERILAFLDSHSEAISALSALAVAAFTLMLVLSSNKLWRAGSDTLTEMGKQREILAAQVAEMRRDFDAEHRPWISVGIEPHWPLTFVADGGCVYLRVALENSGRVPAIRVRCDYEVVPPQTDPLQVQQRIVASLEAEARVAKTPGISVFPHSNPATFRLNKEIPADIMVGWCDWFANRPRFERHFTHIAGCVVYESPLDGLLHHTGFVREMHRMDRPAEVDEAVPLWDIDPNSVGVPLELLRLTGSPLGGGLVD